MRTFPANLAAELASGAPRIAYMMKVTTKDGDVFAFTGHDTHISVDSLVWEPAPGLSQVRYNSNGTAETNTQTIDVVMVEVPDSDLAAGKFDEALIETGWCSWADPDGVGLIFKGTIGELSWSEEGVSVQFVSNNKRLEKTIIPIYTPSCHHELYGSAGPGKIGHCGVDPTAFTFTGTVATVPVNTWQFTISGAAASQPDGYFANGVLTFTSGLNAGLPVVVKKHVSSTLDLVVRSKFSIAPGDTFSVRAGCDKTLTTCKNKFNNVVNHGGFPHLNTDVTLR